FTLQEILAYAKDVTAYRLGETTGFPYQKTTSILSGIGDCVIASDLRTDVIELHRFFFGEDGYVPTSTVDEISSGILYKAGDVASPGDDEYNDDYDYYSSSDYNDNEDDYSSDSSNDDYDDDNDSSSDNNDDYNGGDSDPGGTEE
ncbi:MAG TPA: LytR family transcriptional regulator, partial [Lachnospiraceae bacterium]|nr:LytR family transcriptional regulator [Lachnospiraceae bacterium]